jgi:hypothetical protein
MEASLINTRNASGGLGTCAVSALLHLHPRVQSQGPTFHAMHHYCWGLMRTNRALMLTRTRAGRERYLQEAIWDSNCVIQRAPANFVLLPEILTKKGEHLIRLQRRPLAEPTRIHSRTMPT